LRNCSEIFTPNGLQKTRQYTLNLSRVISILFLLGGLTSPLYQTALAFEKPPVGETARFQLANNPSVKLSTAPLKGSEKKSPEKKPADKKVEPKPTPNAAQATKPEPVFTPQAAVVTPPPTTPEATTATFPTTASPATPPMDTGAPADQDQFFSLMDGPDPHEKEEKLSALNPGNLKIFHNQLKELNDYKNELEDAIETALQLDIGIPIQEIERQLMQGNFQKAQFEHNYLNKDLDQAQLAFREAKRLYVGAINRTTYSPRIEGRAIWLDRGTIVDSGSPEGFKKVLAKLKRAGINIIYFETFNAGFAMFPSKLSRPNPAIMGGDGLAPWDPLKVAVEEGHKLGMEVHAWVWCFAVGNRRHNPIVGKDANYPGPVLEDMGLMTEALRGNGGNLIPSGGRQNEFWLSPASSKARQYLLDFYSEIVTNYDVDGLQLDYIRYPFQKPGAWMGYDNVSRQRLFDATGLAVNNGLTDAGLRTWIAWKTYQVSSFVKETSEKLRAIKPDIKISAAVFPLPRASRIVAIQQDWETWLDNGWIDTLSPMSYTSSPKRLAQVFQAVEQSPKHRAIVYPGIAIHKVDAEDMVRLLNAVREQGALGSTMFAMAHLDESKIRALEDGPYKEKQTATPHKDPVYATITLIGDYRTKLDKLLINQELADVSPETVNSLKQSSNGFQSALQTLKSQPGDMNSKTLAKTNLDQLMKQTQLWLNIERTQHPYRTGYFNELVLRLDQMMAYLMDNKTLPKTEITTTPDKQP